MLNIISPAVCILAELDGQSWSEDETPTLKRSDLVAAATHLVHLLHVDFILKPVSFVMDSSFLNK